MLEWTLGYSSAVDEAPEEEIEIGEYQPSEDVPGEAQLLWCRAGKLPDYNFGSNVLKYRWCEDVYWHYSTFINVRRKAGATPVLTFENVDYRYTIIVNGDVVADGEGMFTPVVVSLAAYEGKPVQVECVVHPAPKVDDGPVTRSQARESVKPPVSYGWDWHPRLVTSGISGKVTFSYLKSCRISSFDQDYELDEKYNSAEVAARIDVRSGEGKRIRFSVLDADMKSVAFVERDAVSGVNEFSLTVDNPRLWWPVRQGEQYLYTLKAELLDDSGVIDECSKMTGFRRVRLVMNEGGWNAPAPATQATFPFTLEVNGRRIFAKGSNFVSADIFYSLIDIDRYRSLIGLALECNMNIFRMWGGSPVNKDEFFELCDKLGMMVWQEFPLSCNNYPDKKHYIDTLRTESTSIVKRLKNHPSVVMWCGGNELFNSWSGMTNQSHALRLLDEVTFENDKNTPFIMTSPIYGVGHGPYVNIVDDNTKTEALTLFEESPRTAYTEFGCPGPASYDYISQYIDEKDMNEFFALQDLHDGRALSEGLQNLDEKYNSPWFIHHAVKAHYPSDTWFRVNEIYTYFYETFSLEECCELGAIIQGACYKAMFEAARRKWPKTSMAINWCFNEPWPCFANNSLVSYPNVLRLAFFDVKMALRDQMLSVKTGRLRFAVGETVNFELFALNDLPVPLAGSKYKVYIDLDDAVETRIPVCEGRFDEVPASSSMKIGDISFNVPGVSDGASSAIAPKTFELVVRCENSDLSSTYTLFYK